MNKLIFTLMTLIIMFSILSIHYDISHYHNSIEKYDPDICETHYISCIDRGDDSVNFCVRQKIACEKDATSKK